MTVDIEIKSNDDDSVTLRVGSITAHITGDGWRDANRAAHVLAAHVAGTYELSALRLRLSGMRSVVADVERSLKATEHHMTELAAYVEEPRPTAAKPDAVQSTPDGAQPMGERLTRLRFHSEGWWVRSCDKHLDDRGPHDRISIGREGYVIATIIPRGDEEPEVHFCGMRPFREDRTAFWELTELACNFAKIMKAADT